MKNHIQTQALLVSAFLAIACIAQATTVDLSSLSSFAGNFIRQTTSGPNLTDDASGKSAILDGSGVYAGVYTPGGSGFPAKTFGTSESLTVEFDFKVSGVNSSIGIYLADSKNLNNNILVLLNVDLTTSDRREQFRIFSDGDLKTGGPGTTLANMSAATTVGAGAIDWSHYTLTLSDSNSKVTLTVGGHSFTYTLTADTVDWEQTIIGMRLSDTDGTSGKGIDFRLDPTLVPEPDATVLLAGIGVLLGLLVREVLKINHRGTKTQRNAQK